MSAQRIGELLISGGLITKDQFNTTIAKQKELKKSFGLSLVELGFMSEEEFITFLGRQFGLPSINLQHYEIDPTDPAPYGPIECIHPAVWRQADKPLWNYSVFHATQHHRLFRSLQRDVVAVVVQLGRRQLGFGWWRR